MTQTHDDVRDILYDQFGIEPQFFQRDKHLINDLHLDSLDLVELTMRLEEEFNAEISDAQVEALQTVGDLIRLVEGITGDA